VLAKRVEVIKREYNTRDVDIEATAGVHNNAQATWFAEVDRQSLSANTFWFGGKYREIAHLPIVCTWRYDREHDIAVRAIWRPTGRRMVRMDVEFI